METVHLYETLTRQHRPLQPEDGHAFRMYVCGPTVYGPAHIGNFRTFIFFDILYRALLAAGYAVNYVRNITDVDDKTIRGAESAGIGLDQFTRQWTEKFQADCATLNLLRPAQEPRATAHIGEQIHLVERLIANGHAYAASDGSVYFKVRSFPEYGKLSHIDVEALRSQTETSGGRRNLADEYEREAVADFALWKAHKPEDGAVAWESPWGRGRPGWHLECSAMSIAYLGETFDLHGGGEDLCFPHHENEIAQSEGATGKPFVRHWTHAVHLLVEGRKMSKSFGNFFTLGDLLAKGHAAQVVRYALLSGHYRQQLNFTFNGLDAARSALTRLSKLDQLLAAAFPEGPNAWAQYRTRHPEPGDRCGRFAESWKALCDDLNTPAALGAFFKAVPKFNQTPPAKEDYSGYRKLMFALGLQPWTMIEDIDATTEAPEAVQALAAERWKAKSERDFARADALRARITEAGWSVLDAKDGYTLKPLRTE